MQLFFVDLWYIFLHFLLCGETEPSKALFSQLMSIAYVWVSSNAKISNLCLREVASTLVGIFLTGCLYLNLPLVDLVLVVFGSFLPLEK